MSNDAKCPYCGKDQEICHDDGYGLEDGEAHQQECHHCVKIFVFYTEIIFSYEVKQADCLNDGNHKWKPQRAYPQKYSQMRCAGCDECRECTPEELNQIMDN